MLFKMQLVLFGNLGDLRNEEKNSLVELSVSSTEDFIIIHFALDSHFRFDERTQGVFQHMEKGY